MALDIIGHEEIIGDDIDDVDYMGAGWSTLGDYLAAGEDDLDDMTLGIGADDEDLASLLAVTGAPAFALNPKAMAGLKKRMAIGRARALAARKRAAMSRVVQRGAVVAEDRRYTRKREYPLGLDSGAVLIAAGASQAITVFPQVTYRAERLQVDSSIAPFFNIQDIVVGKNSQKVTPDPLPASAFSEVAVGVRLLLDTANIGNVISVLVQNLDVVARRFRGTIIGTALDR